MISPTARTLQLLRRRGYLADVVEGWVPGTVILRDLFGCIDVAAVHLHERGVLGVQATTRGHLSARLRKAVGLPARRTWLARGQAAVGRSRARPRRPGSRGSGRRLDGAEAETTGEEGAGH
jgi:hypothetical protein